MNYLINNVCKFTPLFNLNLTKKQNILSCTLFRLENGYKNFNIYIRGLAQLNKFVTNIIPNFRIRLFIDNNIYGDSEIMEKLDRMDKIDKILYECNDFMINDRYHDGLFGTMVRFFPMFDFENNDANIVGIIDADFNKPESYFHILQSFNRFNQGIKNIKTDDEIEYEYNKKISISSDNLSDIYLYFYGRLFHISAKEVKSDFVRPYAVAWKIFNVKRMDKKLLIDYLYEVKLNKNNIIYSDYQNIRDIKQDTNFIFGVDEYFINNTMIEYLYKNKLCFAARYYYQIHFPLFFFYEKIQQNDVYKISEKDIKDFKRIIDFIIGNIKLNNNSLDDKMKFIDEKIYYDKTSNKNIKIDNLFYYINYRIYLAYTILRKNNKYNIVSKNISDLIFKKNFGYIYIEKIETVNCKNINRDIIYKNIKLPKKYLNKIVKKLTGKYIHQIIKEQ